MKLPRRQFLHLAAGAAALPAVSRIAWAQAYPSRPVRIVVGFPAGSCVRHRRAPHRPMAVGAARSIIRHREPAGRRQQYRHRGRREMRRRTATRSCCSVRLRPPIATLYDKLNFNFIRDIAPVAGIAVAPYVHGGQSIVPGQDSSRVHRLCQGQSGQDQYGVGRHRQREPSCAGELFKMMAGIDMVHVPYRGSFLRRSAWRTGADRVYVQYLVDRVHQDGQTARAGGHSGHASGNASGHPDRGRICAGLSRPAAGMELARPRTRRPRSSNSSTRRSTRPCRAKDGKARLADLGAVPMP